MYFTYNDLFIQITLGQNHIAKLTTMLFHLHRNHNIEIKHIFLLWFKMFKLVYNVNKLAMDNLTAYIYLPSTSTSS